MSLWPDIKGHYPDILLSIGTAYNEPGPDDKKHTSTSRTYEPVAWYRIAKKHVKNFLDSELKWQAFRNDVASAFTPIVAQRYIRINPKLSSPVPKMDAVRESGNFRNQIRRELSSTSTKNMVEKVAHRLISSSFYFDKIGLVKEDFGCLIVNGEYKSRTTIERSNDLQVKSNANLRQSLRTYDTLASTSRKSSNGVISTLSSVFMR
jgi:hypothetical protein